MTTRLHAVAGTIERYVILRGEGIVEIDGRAAPVRPGDRVVIRGCRSASPMPGPPTLALRVCTPRFRPEAYIDLGD